MTFIDNLVKGLVEFDLKRAESNVETVALLYEAGHASVGFGLDAQKKAQDKREKYDNAILLMKGYKYGFIRAYYIGF